MTAAKEVIKLVLIKWVPQLRTDMTYDENFSLHIGRKLKSTYRNKKVEKNE